jgi:uncharacterized membrane protein YfcA
MTTLLVLLFLLSVLAFAISAVCGGGAGLMLIPVLGQVLSVIQVPAALSIGTFTSSFSRLVFFREHIRREVVIRFVPAALPAVFLGAWLLKYLDPVYLEIVMGLFLVSNLLFLFRKEQEGNSGKSRASSRIALIGFLAGFLSGLTGAVGLLFNRFYLRYGLTKEEIVATRAANEIGLHVIKIGLYGLYGLMTLKVLLIGSVVAVASVLSGKGMHWLLPLLSDRLFKKIGYGAMVFSGFALLFQSGSDLLSSAKTTPESMFAANPVYELEFTYDEGFELERIVPLSDLSPARQRFVAEKKGTADEVRIEVVYGLSGKSFEAYYFLQNKLIRKLDFS